MPKTPEALPSARSTPASPLTATACTQVAQRRPEAPCGLDGRARVVIDAVLPCVDAGRFPAKHVAGEPFKVTAHCFTDGHDVPRVMLQWWQDTGATGADTARPAVQEIPMEALVNDEWMAQFTPPTPGLYRYTVVAWVDGFESWRRELERRVDPQDIRIAARVGAAEAAAAAARATASAASEDQQLLQRWAVSLERGAAESTDAQECSALKELALQDAATAAMRRHPDRRLQVKHPASLALRVDRTRARHSTWYELFPRSASPTAGVHGTFKDVEALLPRIADMGFDVLYFPPIHPIGRIQRKGKNNALTTVEGDVGSPWAIGAAEGGHKAILAELGDAADFRRLVHKAAEHGLEIALDIAFQCAPDHPYVAEHPDWFRWRPDGTVQYAENPPKKYQDIYPFNFECEDWQGLWAELRSVFLHWIGEGVRIFRVDNPHTKAFPFWEWVINDIQRDHPDVIFLAEAFTRPKVMHGLAKRGFSQSYTYYTWRNSKQELTEYFTELSSGPGRDYFRPNVWPNTPDILHEQLQGGEPAVFMSRLVLAATLAANYGIYGPAYELLEHLPRSAGSEEYLDSEKYQLRHWDLERPGNLRAFISRVNQIRRDNPALHADHSLRFLEVDNDMLIAYAKRSPDGRNMVVTVVNLDPYNPQSGWVHLSPADIALAPTDPPPADWQMHDLLSHQRFIWQGDHHYVLLDPQRSPAHIFTVRRRVGQLDNFDHFE
ncbi:MAG: alpha-1,4-glucan--maltose-1-phosphate maltosyltransferase [Comamonadaceae bacterium]|nr:MAG: alpha-1,4-glucan--maltose-1-phosphate maltosyltransferase [Comamonadaceae bacterium]